MSPALLPPLLVTVIVSSFAHRHGLRLNHHDLRYSTIVFLPFSSPIMPPSTAFPTLFFSFPWLLPSTPPEPPAPLPGYLSLSLLLDPPSAFLHCIFHRRSPPRSPPLSTVGRLPLFLIAVVEFDGHLQTLSDGLCYQASSTLLPTLIAPSTVVAATTFPPHPLPRCGLSATVADHCRRLSSFQHGRPCCSSRLSKLPISSPFSLFLKIPSPSSTVMFTMASLASPLHPWFTVGSFSTLMPDAAVTFAASLFSTVASPHHRRRRCLCSPFFLFSSPPTVPPYHSLSSPSAHRPRPGHPPSSPPPLCRREPPLSTPPQAAVATIAVPHPCQLHGKALPCFQLARLGS